MPSREQLRQELADVTAQLSRFDVAGAERQRLEKRQDAIEKELAGPKYTKLNNKQALTDFIFKHTGVDLNEIVEPRAGKTRTGLGVHLEDLPLSQQRLVREVLTTGGRNLTIDDNGGFGYFIRYEKGK